VTEDLTTRVLANIQEQLVAIRADAAEIRADIREFRTEVDKRFSEVNRRIDMTNRTLLVVEARLSSEISGLRANVLEIESAERNKPKA
jgi:hypothetical protein